jgi:general secretion pathway protein K
MRSRQRGVAIVLAMAVVAFAALTATAIMVSQSTWARRSELMSGHAQAQVLVQAGVDWARAMLTDDLRTSNVDHLGEPWALKLPPIPFENGNIVGYIEDQQGAFNLNNLVRAGKVNLEQFAYFRRLLAILGLPVTLADALVDWMDADSDARPGGGAEDSYYLSLNPPYLTANQPLTDVGELALVRGFDPEVCERLRPFVTALPRFTTVNVNTAPPEVLAAIIGGLNLDGARLLAVQRDRSYFRGPADFSARAPRGLVIPFADISVASEFFMVTVRVTVGEAQARGVALLLRENYGWPAIMWGKYL